MRDRTGAKISKSCEEISMQLTGNGLFKWLTDKGCSLKDNGFIIMFKTLSDVQRNVPER